MNEQITGIEPQKIIATDPALNSQAQLLRARVEAEVGKPAVVMVTSASAGDGKSLTAHSLAYSFANCNHSVALLKGRHISCDRLAALVEKMRAEYDFTIIDAETFVNSSTVMALARLVDGILLAVRIGRAPIADDETMVEMIEQFGGCIVGVVATEADTIADFERARLETLGPARRNAPRGIERASVQCSPS